MNPLPVTASIPLQTERLLLVPLSLADSPAVQALFPQWEIVRYLNNRVPWPYPEDGALSYIRDVALPAVVKGTECHWTLRLKTDPDRIIGNISLMTEPGNNRGFWLHPDWQGHGYMSEACSAINRHWFETLAQPVMQVPKAAHNQASRNISIKEGMRLVGTREGKFVGGDMATEIWEMTREEWLARL